MATEIRQVNLPARTFLAGLVVGAFIGAFYTACLHLEGCRG